MPWASATGLYDLEPLISRLFSSDRGILWRCCLPLRRYHRDHVDRLGNLILLPITLNIEAKRRRFSEKKTVYERHNLRMIREVLEKDDWTLAEIEEREQKLAEWARGEWHDLPEE
jgi:hypothetical protein